MVFGRHRTVDSAPYRRPPAAWQAHFARILLADVYRGAAGVDSWDSGFDRVGAARVFEQKGAACSEFQRLAWLDACDRRRGARRSVALGSVAHLEGAQHGAQAVAAAACRADGHESAAFP